MQKRFLLVRTDRIGDLITVTPAISELRRNFPHAHIAVLASRYAADAVKNNPDINEIIIKDDFFKTLRVVRAGRFDTTVIFFLDAYAALITFSAGIKQRVGPVSKIWAVFLNNGVKQSRSKVTKHEADFNLDLLKKLGITPGFALPKVYVPDGDNKKAQTFLKEKFNITQSDKLIMLHPGSKGSAQNWPAENYGTLARKIKEAYPDFKVMLTGAPSEQALLTEIATHAAPQTPLILKEVMPLTDFIALINQCTFFVSNSTGPLHIAVALGKKTLSFYPNIKGCLPTRWGPYGKGHITLMPSQYCETKDNPDHMRDITPDMAFDAFQKLLAENKI